MCSDHKYDVFITFNSLRVLDNACYKTKVEKLTQMSKVTIKDTVEKSHSYLYQLLAYFT